MLMTMMVAISVTILYSGLKDIAQTPFFSPEEFPNTIKEQSIIMDSPCYNPLTNSLEITLTKKSEEPLKSLTFKLEFDNETKYWKCDNNCEDCKILDEGSKTYYLFPNKVPKVIEIIEEGIVLTSEEITLC